MNETFFDGLIETQDYFNNLPEESTINILYKCLLVVILTGLLSRIYYLYGNSFSDRKNLAIGLIILSLTTLLLITVVKSSLALSLGLVGALSIVRFRTPIKEPEDLTYIFLAIAIGVGYGANQIFITNMISIIIMIFLVTAGTLRSSKQSKNCTTLTIEADAEILLENILNILKKYCKRISLNTFEYSDKSVLIVFDIELILPSYIDKINTDTVAEIGHPTRLSFVDSQYGRVF